MPFFQNVDGWGTSGQLDYDFGVATLTSITAYRRWKNADNNDPDLLPINILDINNGTSKLRQFSQEVRLTSPSGPVEWVAGLFYYNQANLTKSNQTGTLFSQTGEGFGLGFSTVERPGANGRIESVGTFGWGGAYGSNYEVDPH